MGIPLKLSGVAASEGVAVGPAYVYAPRGPRPAGNVPEGAVEEEISRFRRAVEAVRERLSETAARLREAGSGEEAAIFEAHAEIAGDPELAAEVERRVREGREGAGAAVLAVGEEYARSFAAMDDEYMAARADDVRDVAAQIATELVGGPSSGIEGLDRPSVILARNLLPSDTARLPREKVLGFVTAEGSRTSHVAIMARSLGIPAVVGVGEELEKAFGASVVALDGGEGYAVADPDPGTLELFERRRRRSDAEAALLKEYRHIEGRTRDGRRIEVSANLGSPEEAEEALSWGAEGVGLFRTEFLFMERDELPSEEEQYAAYRRVVEVFGERPVIVRTLDVGGDKDLPGIDRPAEENPFLGWRGIRMSLDLPDLFRTQLRAVLRAAAHGNLKVMFPMVTGVEEVRAAREHLEECRRELEEEGTPCGPLEAGVMIETPAAAILAGELAREVSFFSIGTNDLIQYTLAADRGNERLRRLYRADHPAVLELIRHTCEAAREAGIWVGACGEAAGDPGMIPYLVRLGVTELSMSPPSIPRAKKILSEL
ncbi:phosphoenolpyruvate--protein phosphotransferase [Rubrobacter xylanophilus DSM 9941]|uniref:Phosphoenolpyruvate-protein phosphotransferase n=1 Tax=Rubrobacter xylanophilus (strain DSM 9941 / JCM 11954 / NBRC 16129 / PRD-1) TaxID=266117 RepID=Q1AV84_RUBXD|nr:phosphoenolpyruvate--protein phosphotransferase [Rubrobacter xylanophilus]ABG04694.1 phosphoenolpyruvate--protein phosphotransferase [Rubrobacter xylanophilus DSM 9941]